MGIRHTDGVGMGQSRKRGKRAMSACPGRWEQRTESPLRDSLRGGDVGPPCDITGAKGEKRRPAGIGGGRTLGSGGETMGPTRPPEWRKSLRGGATEWAGEYSCFKTTPPPTEWAGKSSRFRMT